MLEKKKKKGPKKERNFWSGVWGRFGGEVAERSEKGKKNLCRWIEDLRWTGRKSAQSLIGAEYSSNTRADVA